MNLSAWFRQQLQVSGEGMIWAVSQVPEERRYRRPPIVLGTWPAVRHLFHLWYYERHIALPSMRQWLGAPPPSVMGLDEEAAWQKAPDLDDLITAFRDVRSEQISCLDAFAPPAWEDVRPTIWGLLPLRWVVTKTYQHTAEHIHDVLQIALFWDMAVG